MKESILLQLAQLFRTLPNFRGKYSMGIYAEKMLIDKYQQPIQKVKLKNGLTFELDLNSSTHKAPFWTGEYDTSLIQKFCQIFQSDWVVFDVGANIGYYAIPFSKYCDQVYCFEPGKSNFVTLSKNIKLNQCQNVEALNFGLGATAQVLQLAFTGQGSTGNAVLLEDNYPKHKYNQVEEVVIKTFDDYFEDQGLKSCDFMKIDIEGHEVEFFKGAERVVREYRPILYAEFNSFFLKKKGQSVLETWEFLSELGYEVYLQDMRGRKRLPQFSKVTLKDGMSDILFVPTDKRDLVNHLITA